MEEEFEGGCNRLRGVIEGIKRDLLCQLDHGDLDPLVPANRSEVRANLKLSYRCLEDARMRLGKAMQAFQAGVGGVSILDDPVRLRARLAELEADQIF